MKFAEYIMAI